MQTARSRKLEVALALLFLTACPSGPSGEPSGPAPVRGGTLRVLLAADVDSLDPNRAAGPSSWFFARAVHRGLFAFPDAPFPAGAQPAPDLAEALPSVRGPEIVITLRAGLRFGAPVDRAVRAADVVGSIARARASSVGIASALADVSSVRARGDRTVIITLARARADLAWILAQPQAAVVPAETPLPGRVSPQDITGAGPYRIVSYVPERSVVLTRNPSWSDDPIRAAYPDRVEGTFGVPSSKAQQMVARGDADLVVDPGPPDGSVAPLASGATGVQTARTSNGCVRFLFMDPRVRPFDSPTARAAVAYAVRRATLPGVGVTSAVATGYLPSTVFGSGAHALPEDVRTASSLLERARLPRGFSTTLVVGNSTRDRSEARAIAVALQRVRISVRVSTVAPEDLYPLWYADLTRSVPMGLATWCADWPGRAAWDVLRGVFFSRGTPPPSVRRVIDAFPARGNDDAAAEADRALAATALVVPLLWNTEYVVFSARVRGFTGAPMWPRGDPTHLWLVA